MLVVSNPSAAAAAKLADRTLQTAKAAKLQRMRAVDSPSPTFEWGPAQLLAADATPPLPSYAAADPVPPAGKAQPKKALAKLGEVKQREEKQRTRRRPRS